MIIDGAGPLMVAAHVPSTRVEGRPQSASSPLAPERRLSPTADTARSTAGLRR